MITTCFLSPRPPNKEGNCNRKCGSNRGPQPLPAHGLLSTSLGDVFGRWLRKLTRRHRPCCTSSRRFTLETSEFFCNFCDRLIAFRLFFHQTFENDSIERRIDPRLHSRHRN